jgi:seryl-tRNA synthetase
LQLDYRVEAAHDPFFVGEFAKQTAFQQGFGLKQEIRAALPHAGNTLAIGSYNDHQDFFGRRLDMRLADKTAAHTGCAAFGLERMVFAFVAQHGIDRAAWPDAVRAGVAA